MMKSFSQMNGLRLTGSLMTKAAGLLAVLLAAGLLLLAVGLLLAPVGLLLAPAEVRGVALLTPVLKRKSQHQNLNAVRWMSGKLANNKQQRLKPATISSKRPYSRTSKINYESGR